MRDEDKANNPDEMERKKVDQASKERDVETYCCSAWRESK